VDEGFRAPERIETARLVLRRPRAADAEAIFAYASDAEVTRYLGWPRHLLPEQTRAFLDFSDDEWGRWPAGPYVIDDRASGRVLGGTGLGFDSPWRASTGYVLARDAWGRGLATEALGAMVEVARRARVIRLYALCHADHAPSRRVLEKGGFACEGLLRRYAVFPNLEATPCDTWSYARVFA
jgi:[ribosomal protein S5]-alanine N-acetyltransferase